MMPPICSVSDCKNSLTKSLNQSKSCDVTFHGFPLTDFKTCEIWVKLCKRSDRINVRSAVVCSDHFSPEDYLRNIQNEVLLLGFPPRKKLKPGAIPSIFPGRTVKVRMEAQILPQERVEIGERMKVGGEMFVASRDMVEEVNDDKPVPCLLCSNCITLRGGEGDNEGSSKFPSLPGATGSNLMNQQLWAVFILRTLLKYPQEKCVELLRKTSGVSSPGNWFIVCEFCRKTVTASMEVYQKIVRLEQNLRDFQKEVQVRIRDSVIDDEGRSLEEEGGCVLNLRSFIRSYFKNDSMDPKRVGEKHTSPFPGDNDAVFGFTSGLEAGNGNGIYLRDEQKQGVDGRFVLEDEDEDVDTSDPLYIPPVAIQNHVTKQRRKEKLVPTTYRVNIGCESDKSISKTSCSLKPSSSDNQKVKVTKAPLRQAKKTVRKQITPLKQKSKKCSLQESKNLPQPQPYQKELQNGLYKCNFCFASYSNRRKFQAHKRNHRLSCAFKCKLCSFPALTVDALQKHMRRHHNKAAKVYKCYQCYSKFFYRSLYVEHKRSKHQFLEQTAIDGVALVVRTQNGDDSKADNDRANDGSSESDSDPEWLQSDATNAFQDKPFSSEKQNKARRGHIIFCDICGRKYTNSCSFIRHKYHHKVYKDSTCQKCNYPCFGITALERHTKQNRCVRQYEYKCDLCDFTTDKRYLRDLHIQNHKAKGEHLDKFEKRKRDTKLNTLTTEIRAKIKTSRLKKNGERIACQICSREYRNTDYFTRHLKDHENNKAFACTKCNFPCSSANALEKHTLNNLCVVKGQKEEFEFKCDVCPFSAFKKYQLQNHLRQHKILDGSETADGRFKCSICDEVYDARRQLSVHKRDTHPEVGLESFKCDICEKAFSKVHYLQTHIETAHENKYKFYCDICGLGIISKYHLSKHMFKHKGTKSFVCDLCGASYTYEQGLKQHLRKCHADEKTEKSPSMGEHQCKYCHAKFSLKLQLQFHLKSTHKDLYIHRCDQCDNSYLSVASLKLHKKINHAGKEVDKAECEFCHRKVTSQVYLYNHYQKYCKKKPPGYQFTMPGVVSKRKGKRQQEMKDTGNNTGDE